MVHSYGAGDGLKAAKVDGYLLSIRRPDRHGELEEVYYQLNLENFFAEVIVASEEFLQSMQFVWTIKLSDGLEARLNKLIGRFFFAGRVPAVRSIDTRALNPFDQRFENVPTGLSVKELIEIIANIYPEPMHLLDARYLGI